MSALVWEARAGGRGWGPGCGCAPIPSAPQPRMQPGGRGFVSFQAHIAPSRMMDPGMLLFPEVGGSWVQDFLECSLFRAWVKVSSCRDQDGLSVTGGEKQAQAKQPQAFCCCLIFPSLYYSTILGCRLFCVRNFCTFLSSFFFFF